MAGGELFGELLDRGGFRSDLLYFIRLAGNYAAAIFIDCRDRAQSKHRRQFALWIETESVEDRHLRDALVQRKPWFDSLKRDFPRLIEAMPQPMRDRLGRTIVQDHAIPLDLRNFVALLDDLLEYRHWLEHWEERKARGAIPNPASDERLLRIIGLMLLPQLAHHLLGRMHHHARKARLRDRHARADRARAIMNAAIADRREASRHVNGLKRRTDLDSIRAQLIRKYGNAPGGAAVHRIAKEEAKKRRDFESRKASLLSVHQSYFAEGTWPRYNYENFLIRFGFIGRGRIAALERLLGERREGPGGLRHDFIHAIEPAFHLSMDIALILHLWLSDLEEAGVPVRKEKLFKRSYRTVAGDAANLATLHYRTIVNLRNAVAHNGWFWEVEDPAMPGTFLSLSDLLGHLLPLPARFGLTDGAERRNHLLTTIEAALRQQMCAYVYRKRGSDDDPNRSPPPVVVRRWTTDTREQYADKTQWRIERRAALRSLTAHWMREVAKARGN